FKAMVKGNINSVKTNGDQCPVINEFYMFDQDKIYLACDDGLFVLEHEKIRQLNVYPLLKTDLPPYLGNITGVGDYLLLTTHELRRRKGLYLYDIKNNRICDALPELSVYLLGKDKMERIW